MMIRSCFLITYEYKRLEKYLKKQTRLDKSRFKFARDLEHFGFYIAAEIFNQ